MPAPTTKESFWKKVAVSSEDACWPYTGYLHMKRGGYGQASWQGKPIKAHRLAYLLANDHLPPALDVLHKCDNPACCNPKHLYLGTDAENSRDKVSRGRQCKGESRPLAKLTEREVLTIRLESASINTVCKRFGVSKGLISGIRNGTRWKHIGVNRG